MRRHLVTVDNAFLVAAMAASTLGATVAFRIWRANWRIPFRYSDDVLLHLMFVKGLLSGGWGYSNPRLGAPRGQQLYDFPVFSGDHLNVLLVKFLGLGSGDAALVMNVFFLLTFPLVALTCFFALRWLSVSPGVSALMATLYSLLPYHFLRGETHLLLAAYYAVPLSCFLILSVLLDKPLFARRRQPGSRLTVWLSARTLGTLGLCVVIAGASGSFYYSGFTMLLVAAAAVLGGLTHRNWSTLLGGGAIVAVILGLSLLSLSPTLIYHHEHGPNPAHVGERHPFESEYYSLRLTQLLLPLQGHRLSAFSHARKAYDDWTQSTGVPSTEAALAWLGTLGGLGFLGLLGVVFVGAIGGQIRPSPLIRAAAVATLLCFLVATMGGFSSLIAFGFPDLRAWNRLSIFIAFFSLLAVGLFLERLRRFPWMSLPLFGAISIAVLGLGFLDQTYPSFVPDYPEIQAQWKNDSDLAGRIEAELPAGAAVFELPYGDFPEGHDPGSTSDYDLVRPYLHTERLRWSFGAMHGRPADWASQLATAPLTKILPAVSAVGFDGVYVDRLGYADNGKRTVGQLTSTLHIQPLESGDKRYAFFDLRPYNQRLKATLAPAEITRLRNSTLALANNWQTSN